MAVKDRENMGRTPLPADHGEVARAAGLVGSGTLVSRVLGLARDVVIAGVFGAGLSSDAFFVALRIPNLIRRLIGEGPVNSAFIPVFTEYRERKTSGEAWRLASNIVGLMGALALLLALAGMLGAPLVVRIMAPEWDLASFKGALTARLTRVMFPYLPLVVLYAVAMAILNSCRVFFIPAMATGLLNLGMIIGALALAPLFDPPVLGLAWGVLLGGSLQLAVNFPALRRAGFRWAPGFDFRDEGVKRVGRLMVPTVVGLAVNDINHVVDTILASFLREGSVSWLFYASRLTQLPLGLVGVAVGTAILPTLSSQSLRGETQRMKETVAFGLRVVLFLTLPAIAGLAVLRVPIAALIFQRGEFSAGDTLQTSTAVLHYSLGIWAAGALRILAAAFYSVRDTRTPFLTALAAMALNVLLSLWLMTFMAHGGLALATSVSLILQCVLLLHLLRRRLGPLGLRRIGGGVAKMGTASAVMGASCALTTMLTQGREVAGGIAGGALVLTQVLFGAAVYLWVSRLLGCEELEFLREVTGRRKR